MAFTPHEDTAVDVCFENILTEGRMNGFLGVLNL